METYSQVYEDLKQLRRSGQLQGTAADVLDRHREMDRLVKTLRVKDVPTLVRHLAVHALAERVFGDAAKAKAWLHQPNKAMASQLPIDLLDDELGAAVVTETLEQIDSGFFA